MSPSKVGDTWARGQNIHPDLRQREEKKTSIYLLMKKPIWTSIKIIFANQHEIMQMPTATDMFCKSIFIESFVAQTVIFSEGQPGNIMYIIQEGQVEIHIEGKIVEVLKRGDIFGEMALIDNSPRSATAVAQTDCKVVPIDQKRFMGLVQQTPYFALKLMQIMSTRLRHMHGFLGAKNASSVS